MSGSQPGGAQPDKAALARLGSAVRARLDADPAVHRVAVDRAEVYVMGGFLSAEECARLIAMIDRVAKPSPTYDPDNPVRYRTSFTGDIDAHDSLVRTVNRRLSDLMGIDERWGEPVQGQRYHPGQEFKEHFDWFDPAGSYWPKERDTGGQRSWTVMAYLNDLPEGGATRFGRIGLSVQPQMGALLIWNNALPDGTRNPDVAHAAEPVAAGAKYVITKWFRTRPWG